METDFCNKCGICCKNIPVDFSKKILYWDGIKPLREEFANLINPVSQNDNISICTCKYLKNNLCTNPNKPEECIVYPSSPFVKLPENCGYEGKIFIEREKVTQKIRKLKEEILHYQVLADITPNKFERNQLQKIISSHQKWIDKYAPFGSADW